MPGFTLQLEFVAPCSLSQFDQRMWSLLVQWMVGVKYAFRLSDVTLQLGVKIVERYLNMEESWDKLCLKYFQLVGASSLLIAAKFEVRCRLHSINGNPQIS